MATPSPSIPEESLPPHQIRDRMRRAVNEALKVMDSDEFQIEVELMPEEERKQAILRQGELYRLRVRLVNEELAEYRDALKENEAALLQAAEALRESTARVEKVAEIIETAGAMLRLATRVMGPC